MELLGLLAFIGLVVSWFMMPSSAAKEAPVTYRQTSEASSTAS